MNNSCVEDSVATDEDERLGGPFIVDTSVSIECETKRVYLESNQDKRQLILFCLGLTTSQGDPLLDPASDAWNAQPIEIRKPTRQYFIDEVKRRGELFDVQPRPKPSQWNLEKMTKWLIEKPVNNPACVQFIATEAARISGIFEEALRVKKSEKIGIWIKNEPWLRLLHCILEDDIRPLYLTRDVVLTRPQLDAVTSPIRPMSIYKRIALRWNDPLFNPKTVASDCHDGLLKYAATSASNTKVTLLSSRRESLESKISEISKSLRAALADRRKTTDPEEIIMLDHFIKEDKKKMARWEEELKVVETRLIAVEM